MSSVGLNGFHPTSTNASNESWRGFNAAEKLRYLKRLQSTPTPDQQTKAAIKPIQWCPHLPTQRQAEFLALDCEEALFGGSAGGGKSDSLLMAALQHVDKPGYAALILRRDYPRLALPGAIMDRARSWLVNSPAVWNAQEKTFRFPSGAVLQFGFIDRPDDRFRYASAEFQFIGWDELTEFALPDDESNPYTFMFSRLRRTTALQVPLRIRAATNPGNIGHDWVKRRFLTEAALAALQVEDSPAGPFWKEARAFVPSKIADNPHLRREEYEAGLAHLPPVTRARLLSGDWSITEQGVVQGGWFRYYTRNGEYYQLRDGSSRVVVAVPWSECQRFAIVDCAGTSEEVARESRGKPPSYSVVTTFDWHRRLGVLMVHRITRGRWSFPELCRSVEQEYTNYRPDWIGVEAEKVGVSLMQTMRHLPLRPISHLGKGKLERAGRLLALLETGKVYFDSDANWRGELESELLRWTGHPDETADQIDTLAYGALHAGTFSGATVLDGLMVGTR